MKFLERLEFENDEVLKDRVGKGKITTHISLFSGCGGLDLGFSEAGIETRVMIEYAKSACDTLRENWLWENLKNRKLDGKPRWKSREELIKQVKEHRRKKDKLKKCKNLKEIKKMQHTDEFRDFIDSGVESWYHENEPVILEKDIKEVTTEEILKVAKLEIGQCSIISGGFPCQGFSLAGKRIIEDPRNALYQEFVRIVNEAKPAMIFGENVPGLVSMKKGEIMNRICEDFAKCGYDITWDILDAADYGVPQHRKRVIMIGKRVDAMIMKEDGTFAIHIAVKKGEVNHPDLFFKKLKRWGNKELLEKLEKEKQRKKIKKENSDDEED